MISYKIALFAQRLVTLVVNITICLLFQFLHKELLFPANLVPRVRILIILFWAVWLSGSQQLSVAMAMPMRVSPSLIALNGHVIFSEILLIQIHYIILILLYESKPVYVCENELSFCSFSLSLSLSLSRLMFIIQ